VPFRIAGGLPQTDVVMNRTFWVGVYPGLTAPMRAFVAEEISSFVRGRLRR
jgi:CDP-6-deoxy-D-xylo-4-hexulose-3-dehydrase